MDKRSMVPSDFGMVKDLVVKYGNKETIGRLAAMGQIDPTSAVLAGMMIDRIRGNAAMEQQPQTTVAQDVMAGQQAAGLGAIAPQGMQAAAPPMQPAAPPMQAPAGMASGGIAALDVPDDMFNEYASGGLVAFEDGGEVPSFQLGGVPGAFNAPDAAQPMGLTPFMNTRARLRAKYGPQVDQMSDTELQMLEARTIMGREPMQEAVGPQVSGDIGQRALAMAQTLFPKTGIETTPYGLEQGMTDVKAAQKAAGVDTGLYERQRADVEQQRAENKATRTESANMRLIEAGLGILGGTSPFASVNIGQGAAPAIKGFAQDVKDIQKLDRELARDVQNLQLAEDKVRRGDATAAQARVDDRLKTIQALQLKRAEAASDISQKMITGEYGVTAQQIAAEKGSQGDRDIMRLARAKARTIFKMDFDELPQEQKDALLGQTTQEVQDRALQIANLRNLPAMSGLPYQAARSVSDLEGDITAIKKNPAYIRAKNLVGVKSDDPLVMARVQEAKDFIEQENSRIAGIQAQIESLRGGGGGPPAPVASGRTPSQIGAPSAPTRAAPILKPNDASISFLKRNPTEQAKKDFDALYGTGAAARYLSDTSMISAPRYR